MLRLCSVALDSSIPVALTGARVQLAPEANRPPRRSGALHMGQCQCPHVFSCCEAQGASASQPTTTRALPRSVTLLNEKFTGCSTPRQPAVACHSLPLRIRRNICKHRACGHILPARSTRGDKCFLRRLSLRVRSSLTFLRSRSQQRWSPDRHPPGIAAVSSLDRTTRSNHVGQQPVRRPSPNHTRRPGSSHRPRWCSTPHTPSCLRLPEAGPPRRRGPVR